MILGPWELTNFLCFIPVYFLMGLFLAKRVHWSVGLAFLLCYKSTAIAAFGAMYRQSTLDYAIYLQSLATAGLMFVGVNTMASLVVHPQRTLKFLAYVNVLNSFWVIYQFFFKHMGELSGGMLCNPSMNGCFIALLLPFINPWLIPICLLAIVLPTTTIPLLVVVAVGGSYFLKTYLAGKDWKTILVGLWYIVSTSAAVLLLANYLIHGFMGDSGRFGQWRASWEYWLVHVEPWFGAGVGTYYLLGAIISQMRGMGALVFTFMHNDWAQILFESGVWGLVSCCFLLGLMLYYTRAKPALFSTICGFAVYMLFNMPCRYVLPAFTGALLIRAAFQERQGCFKNAHLCRLQTLAAALPTTIFQALPISIKRLIT